MADHSCSSWLLITFEQESRDQGGQIIFFHTLAAFAFRSEDAISSVASDYSVVKAEHRKQLQIAASLRDWVVVGRVDMMEDSVRCPRKHSHPPTACKPF